MKYSIKALSKEQRETAEKNGIKRNTLANRLSDGWDIERAITEKTGTNWRAVGNKVNQEGENVSDSWFAGTNAALKCPVEGCKHVGEVITKAHCRIAHNMERNEVSKKYGMPTIVESKAVGIKEPYGIKNSNKWYSTSTGMGAL